MYKKFIYDLIIKEHHLDCFGHMNNAAYLQVLEEARWEMTQESGFGIKQILEKKWGPTLLDVHLQFKREIRLRDEVRITTQVESYEGKVGVVVQEIIRKSTEEVLCVARFKVGLFDLTTRKLIPPNEEWLEIVGVRQRSS